MAFDLLIRDARIIDGSGMPSFHGDVAVNDGKIVETGRLQGTAKKTIDAEGRAVAPGFIEGTRTSSNLSEAYKERARASVALKKAAYSTNIKTRADFSCALFDSELRLIAQSFSQPVHSTT